MTATGRRWSSRLNRDGLMVCLRNKTTYNQLMKNHLSPIIYIIHKNNVHKSICKQYQIVHIFLKWWSSFYKFTVIPLALLKTEFLWLTCIYHYFFPTLTAVMAFPSWTCIALSNSCSFSSLERNTSRLYVYNIFSVKTNLL